MCFSVKWPHLNLTFSNFSEAIPDVDTKQLFVGANVKYSYQQLLDISLKGVYNNWKANQGDESVELSSCLWKARNGG